MTARIFPVCLIVVFLLTIALFRHIGDVAEINKRIRKTATVLLSCSVVCCVAVAVLVSAFSYVGEVLTSVLSTESIAEIRSVLKVVFGSESVFASLQMLGALSLLLFSFASCAFCLYYACYFLFKKVALFCDRIEDISQKTGNAAYCASVKRFALLSRYLI